MRKRYMSIALVALMCLVGAAKPEEKDKSVNDPDEYAKKVGASANEVEGLKLPAPMKVDHDEQFVEVTADCAGPVTWVVLGTAKKIKYKLPPKGGKTIIVGIPPENCTIAIFCVGWLKDDFTHWARTDIVVQDARGPPDNKDDPPDTPDTVGRLLPAGTKLHLTLIENPALRTEETANVIASTKLRRFLIDNGHSFRVRDQADKSVISFKNAAKDIGLPALFAQINDGKPGVHPAVFKVKLPATDDAVIALVKKYVGGK